MDLIDRQRLKDDIAVLFERNEKLIDEWLANCVDDVIDEQPSADVPDRKVGEWIDNNGLYQCSVCKHIWSELWWTSICPIDRMNKMMRFCPNCGARMKGEKSEGICDYRG